ncbi:MAG: signaling protein [Arcobacter sp.]|nr:MAG: signaling protein [Arcobacter sp.]
MSDILETKETASLFTKQEGKTNKNCALARNGFKPYERCNYCELHVKNCMGMHLNLYTFLVGFAVLMFLFIDDPLLIRINIIFVIAMFFSLGYEVTVNTDSLARADFMNQNLNNQLHKHSHNLENEIKRRTKELQNLAVHDTITGLFNRYEFEKRLAFALKYSSKSAGLNIMCYLDLDQFKIVNDTSGHAAGDELLKHISLILQRGIGEKDIVARLGGDEFGILFLGKTIEEATKVCNKILRSIKEYRFSYEDKIFVVGASIGMVPIERDCCTLIDIISAADAACYQAKEKGRNCIHLATRDDKKMQERRGEMQWLAKLTQALEEDMFRLYVQPIKPLMHKESSIAHYEVLIRLEDKEGKIISPMAFIPPAERYGMMQRIDRWVIEEVFRQYTILHEKSNKLYSFSINLSGTSLNYEGLGGFIEDMFKRYSVPFKSICFEITETAAVANLGLALKFINRMRELGCKFSLDDFGSGLSSFSYLQNMPVDYLKIDGAFVCDIDVNEVNRAMVKSINEISHVMGMKTICEFVENKAVEDILKEMDVDFAQGYYYAKPKPIESLY